MSGAGVWGVRVSVYQDVGVSGCKGIILAGGGSQGVVMVVSDCLSVRMCIVLRADCWEAQLVVLGAVRPTGTT